MITGIQEPSSALEYTSQLNICTVCSHPSYGNFYFVYEDGPYYDKPVYLSYYNLSTGRKHCSVIPVFYTFPNRNDVTSRCISPWNFLIMTDEEAFNILLNKNWSKKRLLTIDGKVIEDEQEAQGYYAIITDTGAELKMHASLLQLKWTYIWHKFGDIKGHILKLDISDELLEFMEKHFNDKSCFMDNHLAREIIQKVKVHGLPDLIDRAYKMLEKGKRFE